MEHRYEGSKSQGTLNQNSYGTGDTTHLDTHKNTGKGGLLKTWGVQNEGLKEWKGASNKGSKCCKEVGFLRRKKSSGTRKGG